MDGTGKDQRGAWPDMLLRPPVQALRRSNSTQSARPPRLQSTPLPPEDQQGREHTERTSAPLTLRPSGGRRSASAERGTWVAAPQPKPKAERWVPLPFPQHLEEEEEGLLADQGGGDTTPIMLTRELSGTFSPTGFTDPSAGVRGRILIITSCESFRRNDVVQTLYDALPHCSLSKHPEVVHLEAHVEHDMVGRRSSIHEAQEPGDVFIFDYGVVVSWGLEEGAEQHVLKLLRNCQVKPLPPDEVHQEQITFHYTADQPPHIQNDCITISKREARDHLVKMAISHALAQSCKLNLYEQRVGMLVEQVRHLPESLAKHGEIRMSRQKMAKIKGQVFIQKSEVNLLSTVLDTPDFFWSAPDALRVLYDKVCEYNELSARADLVNSRTMLIQSMLRIWSDHKAHHHLVRLDRIVIILIVVEVVIAAAEVLGFFLTRRRT